MSTLTLDSGLRQEQQLAPRLLQSARILQMDMQELSAYISRLAEENPVLEPERPACEALPSFSAPTGRGVPSSAGRTDTAMPEPGRPDAEPETLTAFLRDQLARLRLEPALAALCHDLAALTDENGYLRAQELDAVRACGVPETLLTKALQTLQRLEPAGVCAADLRECLLLQLRGEQPAVRLARRITERHLEELGRRRFGAIARALHAQEGEVRAAAELIRTLNPRPGAAFGAAPEPAYICPDVSIVERDGVLLPRLNRFSVPRAGISEAYLRLLQETDDPRTHAYLTEKLRQARWVTACLERRRATLERCAAEILTIQWDYFAGLTDELAPMTLQSVARRLGLHESTVCRCVHGKYIQCRRGTFPMEHFFTRAVAGGVSGQAIQTRVAELIRSECPQRPYSDQQLAQLLAEQGMPVARRTVTKYREKLHLPAASQRRCIS